jgi:hypothetical protein
MTAEVIHMVAKKTLNRCITGEENIKDGVCCRYNSFWL